MKIENQIKNVPNEFLKLEPLSGLARGRLRAAAFLDLFLEFFPDADSVFFEVSDKAFSYSVT